MHLGEPVPQLETQTNELPSKRIHEFNEQEKTRTLQELTRNGIQKIKSIFQQFNIKESLQSFFNKTQSTSSQETKQQPTLNSTQISEKTIESKDSPIILKEFNSTDLSSIRADIYTYYKENHTNRIYKAITSKYPDIPSDKKTKALERALSQLSQKPITNFQTEIATQLKSHGIAEADFPRFWQWRQKNLPENIQAKFIYTKTGNKLQFDNFISEEVINKFLDQHISTLSENFFNELEKKSQISETSNIQETSSDVYTSEDIENVFNKELNEFEQYIPNENTNTLTNIIKEQSNGWIDSQSYENIATIPTNDAFKLLGSINSELKPATRQKLFEMKQTISNDTIPFGTFLNDYFITTDNLSKKDISIVSDIITKLNKTIILSKEN
jgi:hypothetical protein